MQVRRSSHRHVCQKGEVVSYFASAAQSHTLQKRYGISTDSSQLSGRFRPYNVMHYTGSRFHPSLVRFILTSYGSRIRNLNFLSQTYRQMPSIVARRCCPSKPRLCLKGTPRFVFLTSKRVSTVRYCTPKTCLTGLARLI